MSTKLQLSLYAKNLPNVAGFLKGTSDPYAVVQKLEEGENPVNVGQTEVVKNSLNPTWTKRFIIEHDPGKPLFVSVAVFDSTPKSEDKSMGSAMFDMEGVRNSKGSTIEKRMKGGGTLYAKVQKYEEGGTIRLQLKAIKLTSSLAATDVLTLGITSSANPFFEIYRQTKDKKSWDLVHRSQKVTKSLSPIWPEADIDIGTLCRNQLDLPLNIKVWDWEKNGQHELIGEFDTSVSGILAAKSFSATMDINTADLASAFTLHKGTKETGQVVVLRADLIGVKDTKSEPEPAVVAKSEPEPAVVATPVEVVPAAQSVPLPAANEPPAYVPAAASVPPPGTYPAQSYAPPSTVQPPMSEEVHAYVAPSPHSPPRNQGPPPYAAPTPHTPPRNQGPPPFVPPPAVYSPPRSNEPPPFVPASAASGAPFVPPGAANPPAFQPYVKREPPMTFEAYMNGGCELKLCVAVDFSSSNGDPRRIGNAHYVTSWEDDKNEYERALTTIGTILAEYDNNKRFPMWGFGAKYGGNLYQCFQCGPSAESNGIEGLLSSYRATFKSGLAMSEPTYISEVVKSAAHKAKKNMADAQANGGQAYTVLMILTDGQLSDFNAEARTIYEVSNSPLSIVAVGIGTGDFAGMRYLDNLEREGRDILKFVPFEIIKNNAKALKAAAIEKIPKQVVGYMKKNGIKPLAPGGGRDIEVTF